MLGKIPLVKGVHVILTKFHNCVLHIRTHGPYRVSQNYNRQACEPFSRCKRQFSWISPVFVHSFLLSNFELQYATENLSDGQFMPVS